MTHIIVIGATLAAFEFCMMPPTGLHPPFNCTVLHPTDLPSSNLIEIFGSDSINCDKRSDSTMFDLDSDRVVTSCCGDVDKKSINKFQKEFRQIIYDRSWVGNETVGDLLVDGFSIEANAKEFLNLLNRRMCINRCDSSLYEVSVNDFKQISGNFIREQMSFHEIDLKHRRNEYKEFLEKIEFNKQIQTIDYSGNDVIVKCKDGSIYKSPLIIYTLPLGVLKFTHQSIFSPALPQRKINAIQGFCTTSTNRIVIEFNGCLSTDAKNTRNFFWRETNYKELDGTTLEWLLGIPGLKNTENKLVGVNIGHYSRLMEEQSTEQLHAGFEFLLQRFYKDLPLISHVKITRFNSDLASLGGNSFNCIAANLFEASREDLAAPAFNPSGDPKIFFAGEATSTKDYGTSVGDISSARREAERVHQFWQNPLAFKASSKNQPLPNTNLHLAAKVDVLVLGAGSAGIAAARALEKNSTLRYLVLEGYHQHGGRAKNAPMVNIRQNLTDVKEIFAGAHWLHAVGNPLYNFAEEHGLLVSPDSLDGVGRFYREDGYLFDDDFVEEISDIVDEILYEAEYFYLNRIVPYPKNLQIFVRVEFEKRIKHLTEEDKVKARQILAWHELWNIIDWAAPEFNKISARTWGKYELIDDSYENKNLIEGAWGLLRDMIADIGGHQFIYNKLVTKIYWSRGHNIGAGLHPKVLIKIADGTIYAADYVIPTFSLGVLKHDHLSMFVPKIPRRHAGFIKCSGFFSITKFFIEFPYRWYNDELGFNYVYENRDPEAGEWRVWINRFDKIFPGNENILLGWAGGLGQFGLEQLTDKEIIDSLMFDMRNKFLSQTNFTIPDPIRYFVSHWLPNPLTRGCYSFPSAACDCPGLGQEDLIRPIRLSRLNVFQDTGDVDEGTGAPVLLFAGEGASAAYHSTLHGAHFTGIEQANVIIESVNK